MPPLAKKSRKGTIKAQSAKNPLISGPETINILRLLADQNRAAIIEYLAINGEANVTELTEAGECSQPSMSHHLKLLKTGNVVRADRREKHVFYSLNRPAIVAIADALKVLGNTG